MERPLVSIVVPGFNQGHYLPIALDSILFQDYEPIEIIVTNHGSTDDTSLVIKNYIEKVQTETVSYLDRFSQDNGEDKLIRAYEKRYPQGRNIKVIESDENIGGTSSYNEGFMAAIGKYCTYLVADDYFLPGAISKMVEKLESRDVDIVFSDMYVVDDQGHIMQHLRKPEFDFKRSLADWFHLGVCRLYRRELHLKTGYYDPEYKNANDYDMFLRFAMDGASFYHIPEVLYCTRKHNPENLDEPASWRNGGYENLMRESKICALRARKYLKGNKS